VVEEPWVVKGKVAGLGTKEYKLMLDPLGTKEYKLMLDPKEGKISNLHISQNAS